MANLRPANSFNPCCNGIQSVGLNNLNGDGLKVFVSILVVMEFSLLAHLMGSDPLVFRVSILVVMEFSLLVVLSLF